MKTKMIALILVLGSWGAIAQHDHPNTAGSKMDQNSAKFKNSELGKAYEDYIQLKDALVASKADAARESAKKLQNNLIGIESGTKAIEAASLLASQSDLTEQRKTFSTLSNEMARLVKGGKLSMGMLYLEYCPMANGNVGAYWLSNEKEIKNPYFGDAMMTCGSVKEMIH